MNISMKKETFLLAYFFFTLFCVSAQSIDQQAINAAGDHYVEQNQVTVSIGEAVVSHFQSAEHQVTSGFHQPTLEVALVNSVSAAFPLEVEVYPNPTTDYLNLRVAPETGNSEILTGQIFNESGQVITEFQVLPQSGNQQIDFTGFPEGLYMMRLQRGRASNLYKILKN